MLASNIVPKRVPSTDFAHPRPPVRVGEQVGGHFGVELRDDDSFQTEPWLDCGGELLWVVVGVVCGQSLGRRGPKQTVVGAEKDQFLPSRVQKQAIDAQRGSQMDRI